MIPTQPSLSGKYIKQFMWQTFRALHPQHNKYPFKDMERAEWSKGDEFEGTEFEHNDHLIQAFYMRQSLRHFGIKIDGANATTPPGGWCVACGRVPVDMPRTYTCNECLERMKPTEQKGAEND